MVPEYALQGILISCIYTLFMPGNEVQYFNISAAEV
jgi:hypothetical protein